MKRAAPLAVAALALATIWPVPLGRMPVSADHPVHLYRAWFTWTELLPIGSFRGWSDDWFFGYPHGDLYPPGTDLWVCLWRALTLGQLAWTTTYALAFAAAIVVMGLATWAFTRSLFGPVAALVAAALALTDPGFEQQGGWSYAVHWGVWGQPMAMALLWLALARLFRMLDAPRTSDLPVVASLAAVSVLFHPTNLVLLALALPALWLARRALRRRAGEDLRDIALAGVLALGLSAVWWLPMASRAEWTVDIGTRWLPLAAIGRDLLHGRLLVDVPAGALALAGLGAVLGWRRWGVLFLVLLALLLLLLASNDVTTLLSDHVSPDFARVRQERLVIAVKGCVFPLAGFATARLVEIGRRWGAVGWVALVPALVVVGLSGARIAEHGEHRTLTTTEDSPWWGDFEAMAEWTAEHASHAGVAFQRIAWEGREHDHRLMAAPVWNATPLYKAGFTPASLFVHRPSGIDDALYRKLSVRWILRRNPPAAERRKVVSYRGFDRFQLFRFTDWRPERFTAPGVGRVEVVEFSRERVHLRLSDVQDGATVVLHRAVYPRWEARLNGRPVAIGAAPAVDGGEPMLQEIPAEDGDLVVVYRWRTVERLGALATAAAALLLVLLWRRRLAVEVATRAVLGRAP